MKQSTGIFNAPDRTFKEIKARDCHFLSFLKFCTHFDLPFSARTGLQSTQAVKNEHH